jgi:protein SCO1/2
VKATLAACALLAAGFLAGVAQLTDGYERWTFESLRREAAREGRLRLPDTALRSHVGPLATGPAGVRVVDFIYTRCESVCLALGAEFFQMQQALRADEGVRLLSVSIDPEHDGAAELAAYAQRFRADAARWAVAAPVSPAEGRAALRALGVVAVPDGLGGFVHNGAIHVVDAGGRVRGIFDYADWPAALAAARRLQP